MHEQFKSFRFDIFTERDEPFVEQFHALVRKMYAKEPFHRVETAPFPAGAQLFLVRRLATIIGRCAVSEFKPGYLGQRTAMIGWFEVHQDPIIAKFMFLRLLGHLSRQGYNYVVGPINGSMWHQYRFAEHERTPFFLDVEHKHWYGQTFLDAKFDQIQSYTSYRVDVANPLPKAELRHTLRHIDTTDLEKELRGIYDVTTLSYAKKPFYLPATFEEYAAKYLAIAGLFDKRFTVVCEDAQGKVIGAILAFPNYNNPSEKSVVAESCVVSPRHLGKGLEAAMVTKLENAVRDAGYQSVIYATCLDGETPELIQSRGEAIQNYHMYGRPL